ncbi:MAG: sigma-70 family RNA polymerase sigma factor [Magnetococcales bacterium]|nr:sigma-70 family RNA polymerase sigma factor [Magnetococcales bacterium]
MMSRTLALRPQFYPTPVDGGDSGFRTFIAKAMQAPILTAEEEMELAMQYLRENDPLAAQALVVSHLRLVYKISIGYKYYGIPLPDLVQEGTIGLMHAIKKFNPLLGARLSTYATWWIRAAIYELILRSWSVVKIATSGLKRKLFFKLRQAKNKVAQLSWEEAEELALKFGTDPETIINMDVSLSGGEVSLDKPTADSQSKMLDIISDERPDQEAEIIMMDQNRL